jgi:inner membrane protein
VGRSRVAASGDAVDPVTHALLGSAAARVALTRPLARAAWLPGAVGALLPDVDALIRSSADPLLYAEFHRHFTHSLAFIPAGGTLAALPWLVSRRTRGRWKAYVGAATAGYATHGVLDASTTYGTLLLWPFTDRRVAWNWISIVDPLFTVILLAGVVVALWRGSARPAAVALLVCLAYLGAGAVQRERALEVQQSVAAARGHAYQRGEVFPGFGNNIVWRSLYQAGDTLYLDRLRVPWRGTPAWSPGTAVALVQMKDLPAEVRADVRLRRDFRRFHWFASGWVARAPREPDVIGDARYSASTERFEPVWGIRFTPESPSEPIQWVDRSRERRLSLRALWAELRGLDPTYRPIRVRPGV